jgi:flagellar basal-body rod protein FlgF
MLKELYTAAAGMMPQQTRLEVIANNMANANTVGFKRQAVFERNLIDARSNFYNVPGDSEQDDPPQGSYIDFSQGSFDQTNNPLDIAIDNKKGFFVVQDENGNEFLTKNGHFQLSPDGTVTATDGKMLMGTDGRINVRKEFIVDPLNAEDAKQIKIKITENGEVFANESPVGSVLVTEVENPESLECISGSNFIATDKTETNQLSMEEVKLRQGWVEDSNVNIISEMVQMIELQRMYEVGSKVIHTNDATLDQSMRIGRYM